MPTTPCSNSSRSSETQFSRPWTRAMPSPTCSTVPTSDRSVSTSYCSIRDLRIEVISSGRSFTLSPCFRSSSSCGGELVAEALQAAAHAGVDAQRACLQDHAADQLGIDLAGRLDRAAGGLLDLRDDRGCLVVGQLVARSSARRRRGPGHGRRAPGTRRGSPGIWPARPFSASRRRKLRTSSSAPSDSSPSTPTLAADSTCGLARNAASSGDASTASANAPRSRCTASTRPCPRAASNRARAYRRSATATAPSPSPARAPRSRGPRSPRRSAAAGRRSRAPCRRRAASPRG